MQVESMAEGDLTPNATDLLAAIVESSEDPILAVNYGGTIISWNRAAVDLFGYRPEEVIGRPITDLAASGATGQMLHLLERARSGERIRDLEVKRRKKDGSLVDVRITVSPVRDGSGRILAFSTIYHDLTERNRQVEALRAKDLSYQKVVETAN